MTAYRLVPLEGTVVPKPRLLELLNKMRIAPRQLLRTKETIYKTLKLGDRDLSDDEIVDLIGEASGSDSAADRREWRPRDSREACRAPQRNPLTISAARAMSWPQESGLTN